MKRSLGRSHSNFFVVFVLALFLFLAASYAQAALNCDQLSKEDVISVQAVLKKIDPVILEKDRAHALVTLTFDDLYRSLTKSERRFLQQFLHLNSKKLGIKIPYRGMASGKEKLVKIVGQKVKVLPRDREKFKTDTRELPVQFLPPEVFKNFTLMMDAMEKDIGKRLFVESAYRSSAYQLYLFIFYLKKHHYSIKETAQFVALPGFSEHGSVKHQALDFINAQGIDGQEDAKEFEALDEFAWLQEHAKDFGFVLSYPKGSLTGIAYEPWHWRYDGR
ncbi:MAG: M15 family metallopeptidase [Candidatus Omnitrophota bacterium]